MEVALRRGSGSRRFTPDVWVPGSVRPSDRDGLGLAPRMRRLIFSDCTQRMNSVRGRASSGAHRVRSPLRDPRPHLARPAGNAWHALRSSGRRYQPSQGKQIWDKTPSCLPKALSRHPQQRHGRMSSRSHGDRPGAPFTRGFRAGPQKVKNAGRPLFDHALEGSPNPRQARRTSHDAPLTRTNVGFLTPRERRTAWCRRPPGRAPCARAPRPP